MSYTSGGEIQTSVSPINDHRKKVVVEGRKNFYLWGLFPTEHKVYIDRELLSGGLISAASIRIDEYQNPWENFLTIISFGMFVPMNYRISAFGKRVSE
jgi:hypothetical protein